MNILVNGTPHDVPEGTTISALLDALDMAARHVAVEVNLQLVPRAQHADHKLHEDDQLEVVTLVGGG
ncbi:MAG: sulfur carrier protein ThiS [Planctomycetota bacterium]|nr:MAG: sulfur carrier protein ThiS [Planctomycetota bacterium]